MFWVFRILLGGNGWSSGRRGGSCHFISLRTTLGALFPAKDSIVTLLASRHHPCLSPSCPQADHPLSAHQGPQWPQQHSGFSALVLPYLAFLPSPPMGQGSTGIQSFFSHSLGGCFTQVAMTDLFPNGPGLRCTVSVSVCELMLCGCGCGHILGVRERSDCYCYPNSVSFRSVP